MISSEKLNYLVLAILDGWGLAKAGPGNAISLANTPNIDRLSQMYPHTRLAASGASVGLPEDEEGNTETGHLNLGAGTIVYQDLERVNRAIEDGRFFKNSTILSAIAHAERNKSVLHLMGLLGRGYVHSSKDHLLSLIKIAKNSNTDKVYLHLFTDGRDSPPKSAIVTVKEIEDVISDSKKIKIASIMGRFYAMDRDNRWDRTLNAYHALTLAEAARADTPEEAIQASYNAGVSDEFIEPVLILNKEKVAPVIKDNDSVIFFNFRIDRPRQLTKAFVFRDFDKAVSSLDEDSHAYHMGLGIKDREIKNNWKRKVFIKNLFFVTMTKYSESLTKEGAHAAFPPEVVGMPLGRVLSTLGLRQLRISESEKERFVSVYFDGLREQMFEQEEKIVIPSPHVRTYDLAPEMSADTLTQELLDKMLSMEYKFIVVNYPNADMVGHTGNIKAAIRAVEKVDACIGKIASVVLASDGCLLITADHGNVEEMLDENGNIDTEHSRNPVPFIVIQKKYTGNWQTLPQGILADVAPTILSLLSIPIPVTMNGRNLMQGLI
jgi:2,3-bisphosphoglycerate-independent phosphoglycerate mutase